MNKLLKLSETHYIIVDDSEMKENDYRFNTQRKYYKQVDKEGVEYYNKRNDVFKKIIYSTEPIEVTIESPDVEQSEVTQFNFNKIKSLSLLEVEELINGYNVEKMAFEAVIDYKPFKEVEDYKDYARLDKLFVYGFHNGFNAHQKLVKDKLFTVEDMLDAMGFAAAMDNTRPIQHLKEEAEEYIKTEKLPKTEWDVTFDKNNKLQLI